MYTQTYSWSTVLLKVRQDKLYNTIINNEILLVTDFLNKKKYIYQTYIYLHKLYIVSLTHIMFIFLHLEFMMCL
jgi:hypothetical protein